MLAYGFPDGPGRPPPGPVSPCSDPQSLLAQNTEKRPDYIAFGTHLVHEREDQRLRGGATPACGGRAPHAEQTSATNCQEHRYPGAGLAVP